MSINFNKNRAMNKISTIILMAVLALTATSTANAQTFSYNGLNFEVNDPQEKTATFTGIRFAFDMTAEEWAAWETLEIPSTVTDDKGNSYSVTSMRGSVYRTDFMEAPVKHLIIPETVVSISTSFSHCSNLETVIIPQSVTYIECGVFAETKLKSVELPDGITELRYDMFANCKELKEVKLPAHLTKFEDRVFKGCSSLTSITLPESLGEIQHSVFEKSGLQTVNLPESLGCIYEGAFAETPLKSVRIPANVQFIEGNPFYGCTSLTDIDIDPANTNLRKSGPFILNGDGDVLLAASAVSGKVSVPDGIREIGTGAFALNTALTGVSFPQSLESLGGQVFKGCTALTDVDIPGSVEVVPESAFQGCKSLGQVTFNEGTKIIGAQAFARCTSLREIKFPESLEEISGHWGDPAPFIGCDNLARITFGKGIKTIEGWLFGEGNNLFNPECELVFTGQNPPETFNVCYGGTVPSSITVIVPEASWQAYVDSESMSHFDAITAVDNATGKKREVAFTSEGVVYRLKGSGEISLVRTKGDVPAELILPSTVQDRYGNSSSLTSIAPNAFSKELFYPYGNQNLKKISIPASVKTIGERAFEGCFKLTEVSLANGIETIGKQAFLDCSNLRKIEVPGSVKRIEAETFMNCTRVETLVLHEGLEEIGDAAFKMYNGQTDIAFPSTLREIGDEAFFGLSLQQLNLPAGLDKIGASAFAGNPLVSVYVPAKLNLEGNPFGGCTTLQAINIDPANPYLISDDGIVYSRDYKRLIIYPAAREGRLTVRDGVEEIGSSACQGSQISALTFPASLRKIGDNAFSRCPNLEEAVFNGDIEEIGDYAFYENYRFWNINLPETVRIIGAYAFHGCPLNRAFSLMAIESVGEKAFYQYRNSPLGVTRVDIGPNAKYIGDSAFDALSYEQHLGLNDLVVRFWGTTPPDIDWMIRERDYRAAVVIEVPLGTLAAYRAAYKGYYTEMREFDPSGVEDVNGDNGQSFVIQGNILTIAPGQTLDVYDFQGHHCLSHQATSEPASVTLPSGLLILVTPTQSAKVLIP